MALFLLLVGVPILEIALFIQIGGFIGLVPTLAVILLTALIGTVMMRRQGISALNRLQDALATGRDPSAALADGAAVLIAGLLLLTPGFFTDAIGLALLVPSVRRWIIARVARQFVLRMSTAGRAPNGGSQPIDADYDIIDDPAPSGPRASGTSQWTRREP
jgi:UPF0716 protein FxsA